MKDAEIGDDGHAPPQPPMKESFFLKHRKTIWMTLGAILVLASTFAVMFGMGIVAALYVDDHHLGSGDTVAVFGDPVSDAAHGLVRRDDCNETEASYISAADAVTAVHSSYEAGAPIPITTIYSTPISAAGDAVVTMTSTTTQSDIVTVFAGPPSSSPVDVSTSSEDVCEGEVVTKTVTKTIIPAGVSSISYAPPGGATVTGNPATVTAVQTDVSYTSGLPDATVSGNPSTVTAVQTDISVSSGLPDATVSGNPVTVTNFQTDVSITSGLPDATVSGNPATVTDVDVSYSLTTVTSSGKGTVVVVETARVTLTTTKSGGITITVTDLYPPASSTVVASSLADGQAATATSAPPVSTKTTWTTQTTGSTSVSLVTVPVPSPPYPSSNATVSNYGSGTVTYTPIPSTPVVISGATKKPNGLATWTSVVALFATVMFLF